METSVDVYAETNPVFLSFVLWNFLRGHEEVDRHGAVVPLLFLPIPIVLSTSTVPTFKGTNKTTGLIAWLNRNPELALRLPSQIDNSVPFVKKAILFGLSASILEIQKNDGTIKTSNKGLTKSPKYPASDNRGLAFGLACRFGFWVGEMRSPKTVLNALGIVL